MQRNAYAKINLTLDITGTDDRGYHLLSSVFARISLFDTVTLTPSGNEILLTCDRPSVPLDHRNLCHKAARLLLEEFSLSGGFKIDLQKRIPDCAGLGGGSSDAAAVLEMLCSYYGISTADPRVLRTALRVGADVPFFLKDGPCLAEGVGEILTPIPPLPDVAVLIAKTEERASTPEIFSRYDRLAVSLPSSTPGFLSALNGGTPLAPWISNHLTPAAATLCPSVLRLKDELRQNGAFAAEMSGSGSAVYGLFSDPSDAERAKEKINAEFREVCRFV